jgi:hypothetical protein
MREPLDELKQPLTGRAMNSPGSGFRTSQQARHAAQSSKTDVLRSLGLGGPNGQTTPDLLNNIDEILNKSGGQLGDQLNEQLEELDETHRLQRKQSMKQAAVGGATQVPSHMMEIAATGDVFKAVQVGLQTIMQVCTSVIGLNAHFGMMKKQLGRQFGKRIPGMVGVLVDEGEAPEQMPQAPGIFERTLNKGCT